LARGDGHMKRRTREDAPFRTKKPAQSLEIDPGREREAVHIAHHVFHFTEGGELVGQHEVRAAAQVQSQVGRVGVESELQTDERIEPAGAFRIDDEVIVRIDLEGGLAVEVDRPLTGDLGDVPAHPEILADLDAEVAVVGAGAQAPALGLGRGGGGQGQEKEGECEKFDGLHCIPFLRINRTKRATQPTPSRGKTAIGNLEFL